MIKRAFILRRQILSHSLNGFQAQNTRIRKLKFRNIHQVIKSAVQIQNKSQRVKKPIEYLQILESIVHFTAMELNYINKYDKEIDSFIKEISRCLHLMNIFEIIDLLKTFGKRDKLFRIKRQTIIQFQVKLQARISQIISKKSQAPNIKELQELLIHLMPIKRSIKIAYQILNYFVTLNPSKVQYIKIINIFQSYGQNSLYEMKVQICKFIMEQVQQNKLPQSSNIALLFASYNSDWSFSVHWFHSYIQKLINKVNYNQMSNFQQINTLLKCILKLKYQDPFSDSYLYSVSEGNILKLYNLILDNLDKLTFVEIFKISFLSGKYYLLLDPTKLWLHLLQVRLTLQNIENVDNLQIKQLIFILIRFMRIKPELFQQQFYRKKLWKIFFKYCIVQHKKKKSIIGMIKVLEHMTIICYENKNNFVKFLHQYDSLDHRPFVVVRLHSVFKFLQIESKYISRLYEDLRITQPGLVVQNLARTMLKDHNLQEIISICKIILRDSMVKDKDSKNQASLWRAIITSSGIKKIQSLWDPHLLKIIKADYNLIYNIINFLQSDNYQISKNQVQTITYIILHTNKQVELKQIEHIIKFGRLDSAFQDFLPDSDLIQFLTLLLFISMENYSPTTKIDTRYALLKYILLCRAKRPNKQIFMQTIIQAFKAQLNYKRNLIDQYNFYPQLKELILWTIKNNRQFPQYIAKQLIQISSQIIKHADTLIDQAQLIEWFAIIANKHQNKQKHFNRQQKIKQLKENQLKSQEDKNNYEIIFGQVSNIKLYSKSIVSILCRQLLKLNNINQAYDYLIQISPNISIQQLLLLSKSITNNRNIIKTDTYKRFQIWIKNQIEIKLKQGKNNRILQYLQIILIFNIQLEKQKLKLLSSLILESTNLQLFDYLIKSNFPVQVRLDYIKNCLNNLQQKLLLDYYFVFFPEYTYELFSGFLCQIILSQNLTLLKMIIDMILTSLVEKKFVQNEIQTMKNGIKNSRFKFWLMINCVKFNKSLSSKIDKILIHLNSKSNEIEQNLDNFVNELNILQQKQNIALKQQQSFQTGKSQKFTLFQKKLTINSTKRGQYQVLTGKEYDLKEKRVISVILSKLIKKNKKN